MYSWITPGNFNTSSLDTGTFYSSYNPRFLNLLTLEHTKTTVNNLTEKFKFNSCMHKKGACIWHNPNFQMENKKFIWTHRTNWTLLFLELFFNEHELFCSFDKYHEKLNILDFHLWWFFHIRHLFTQITGLKLNYTPATPLTIEYFQSLIEIEQLSIYTAYLYYEIWTVKKYCFQMVEKIKMTAV